MCAAGLTWITEGARVRRTRARYGRSGITDKMSALDGADIFKNEGSSGDVDENK
jgi:hypothetical protein